MRLEQDQLRDLAELVAEALARRLHDTVEGLDAAGLVDATAVADALGVTTDFVYRHQEALGVVRLGGGSRPRLRFNLQRAVQGWASCSARRTHEDAETRTAQRKRRRRPVERLGTRPALLPIRGRAEGDAP